MSNKAGEHRQVAREISYTDAIGVLLLALRRNPDKRRRGRTIRAAVLTFLRATGPPGKRGGQSRWAPRTPQWPWASRRNGSKRNVQCLDASKRPDKTTRADRPGGKGPRNDSPPCRETLYTPPDCLDGILRCIAARTLRITSRIFRYGHHSARFSYVHRGASHRPEPARVFFTSAACSSLRSSLWSLSYLQ